MSTLDQILERLRTDTAFRASVASRPQEVLAPYALSGGDLEAIVIELDEPHPIAVGRFQDLFELRSETTPNPTKGTDP